MIFGGTPPDIEQKYKARGAGKADQTNIASKQTSNK
jgi:hypothetical protein